MRLRHLVVLVSLGGCNTPTYLNQHRPLETMADPMGQGYAADTDLYILPVRRPTQEERQKLQDEQRTLALMMEVPWASTRDFALQIEYSLKNLDDHTVTAFFTANGGNEFGDYDPNLYVDMMAAEEDQQPPPALLGGSPIVLSANEIRQGVFREDQITEASLDLEAITRYPAAGDIMATPFMVIAHDSTASRIGLEDVPAKDVIPLWVRYQLNLSADGHVVCDYNVRVRQIGEPDDKLGTPGARGLYVSTAASVTPPADPNPPMMMMPSPSPSP